MRQTGRGKRKTGRKKYTYEKPHTAAEYRRRRRQQQVRIQRMLLLLGIVLVVIFIFVSIICHEYFEELSSIKNS